MKSIRKIIREMVEEAELNIQEVGLDEAQIDEERITNTEAGEAVNKRENFVASHTYGEDLGNLGDMWHIHTENNIHYIYGIKIDGTITIRIIF